MRMINADAIAPKLEGKFNQDMVRYAPTIEAEPVKHGRWTENHHVSYDDMREEKVHWYTYTCSECDFEAMDDSRYCPNCGAKMDLNG